MNNTALIKGLIWTSGTSSWRNPLQTRPPDHRLHVHLQPCPVAGLHLRDPESARQSRGGKLLRLHALDRHPEGHPALGCLFQVNILNSTLSQTKSFLNISCLWYIDRFQFVSVQLRIKLLWYVAIVYLILDPNVLDGNERITVTIVVLFMVPAKCESLHLSIVPSSAIDPTASYSYNWLSLATKKHSKGY